MAERTETRVKTPTTRKYGIDWNLMHDPQTDTWEREQIQIILLQEIRDILKQSLGCANFATIPATLRKISRQVARRRRKPTTKPRR